MIRAMHELCMQYEDNPNKLLLKAANNINYFAIALLQKCNYSCQYMSAKFKETTLLLTCVSTVLACCALFTVTVYR